jgi:hypothetical protein
MADYFAQFSALFFEKLTQEEEAWLKHMLSLDSENDAIELEATLPGVDLEYGWPGFDGSIDREVDPRLWVRSEDSFCPENVAALLQAFILRFRPTDIVSFTWAGVCSRPVAGEFGGGWAVVSADDIVFGNTWDAATAARKKMIARATEKGRRAPRPKK